MSSPTSRLLQLLSLLQARRDWPGALLADRLSVSHRTIRRDVDRLRDMGYRIEATMGPDGGYRLDAGSELPPLLFDDDQVVALTVALQTAAVAGAGIGEAALRALTTVRQVLPSRVRHRLDALEVANVARAGAAPTPTVSSEVLLSVSAAIRDRHVLRFGRAVDDPAPPRRVEPHHLVLSDERWYLVAWDLDRDDWRIFRADRLVPRTPTGPRFHPRTVPGGDVRAFVAARFKGSEYPDRWPCVGTVLLHLPLTAVQPFVGDGAAEAAGDDRTRYTSGAWSWVALAASLNRFDTEVEVVEPPELAAAFAVLADRNAATATRGASAQR